MIRIVCTTEKEKKDILEAAYYIRSLKNLNNGLAGVTFISNLNPGEIEVSDTLVVKDSLSNRPALWRRK